MYVEKLSTEAINLANDLREKLGVTTKSSDKPFTLDVNPFKNLEFLPIENLEAASKLNITKTDSRGILNELRQAGCFSFEPYVYWEPNSNPSLVLGLDAFLHFFRKHYFQVSYTENGQGSRDINHYRLDSLLSEVAKSDMQGSLFEYALWFMNVCALGMNYSNFTRMFKGNPAIIDEFLSACFNYWHVKNTHTYKDLAKSISIHETDKLEISDKNGMIYVLRVNKVNVAYVTCSNILIEVQVPNYYYQFRVPLIFDEDINTDTYINQLTLGLLAIAGVFFCNDFVYVKKDIIKHASELANANFNYRFVDKLSDFER